MSDVVTVSVTCRTCTICKRQRYGKAMVKHGVRHYACAPCWTNRHPRFFLTMEPSQLSQMPLEAFASKPQLDAALARVSAWRETLKQPWNG